MKYEPKFLSSKMSYQCCLKWNMMADSKLAICPVPSDYPKELFVKDGILKPIQLDIADMSLEWCKLIVSSSGWVSDNYVGFVRVCEWFYYPITVCIDKSESYGMLNQFVGSLLSMISLVMRKHVCDKIVHQIEREIKLFLSLFLLEMKN